MRSNGVRFLERQSKIFVQFEDFAQQTMYICTCMI